MSILERIMAKLADLESAFLAEEARHNETVARLMKQKAALKAAANFATPEAEQALITLEKLGVINAV